MISAKVFFIFVSKLFYGGDTSAALGLGILSPLAESIARPMIAVALPTCS